VKPEKQHFVLIALILVLVSGSAWISGSSQAMANSGCQSGTLEQGNLADQASVDQLKAENRKLIDDDAAGESLTSTVGFPKLLFQHKIAGTKVVAKPITGRTQPVIVRIVDTYPHGSDFRYDIEYKGLEPGTFDVAEYLERDDGSSQPIPSIEVQVFPILAKNEVLPYNLPRSRSQFRSYYLPLLLVVGAVWLAGLLMILFYGRGKTKHPSREQKQLTVADRMRPLIDAAIAGQLTTQQQAELERVLSGFWSKKLRLNHLSADELRQKLREHEEASLMLNQIDSWLHRPATDPTNAIDVNELLKPYQAINDDSF
jgi:hypothetical protein